MERQYIGARYVPKVYENSLDPLSAEWEANTSYEALTQVTYQNAAYTSKKPVPSTVGNPASNPTYWVKTSDYNGMIANLQTQINAVDTKVDTVETSLKTRTFLLFGDSLYDGYTPDDSTRHGWGYWVAKYLTDKGYTVYRAEDVAGVGVSGFGTNKTYVQHLEETITQHPNIVNVNITDVVVYSGTNDRSYVATTAAGIGNFVAAIKQYWPNADIKIGYFSPHHDANGAEIVKIFKECGKYGCTYIDHSAGLCCRKDKLSSDNTHLSVAGYEFYSPYLTDGAIGGCISYDFAFTDIEITNSTATFSDVRFNIRIVDDIIYPYLSNYGSGVGTIVMTMVGTNPGQIDAKFANPLTFKLKVVNVSNMPYYDSTDGTLMGIAILRPDVTESDKIKLWVYGAVGTGTAKVYGDNGTSYNL